MRYEPHQLHERLDRGLPAPEVSPFPWRANPEALPRDPQLAKEWDEAVTLHNWVQEQFAHAAPTQSPSAASAWQRLKQANPEVAKPPKVPKQTAMPWWQSLLQLRWPALAAACCLMALLPTSSTQIIPQPKAAISPIVDQPKGVAPIFQMLHAHRRDDAPNAFKPAAYTRTGTQLRPGDLVQFAYRLPAPKHVMILSLNQRGELFSFFPLKGNKSTHVTALTGTLPRQKSLVLDHYIGQERFFMVASDKPFTYQQIKYAIDLVWQQRSKQLSAWPGLNEHSLFKGWQITTLLIQKQRVLEPSELSFPKGGQR